VQAPNALCQALIKKNQFVQALDACSLIENGVMKQISSKLGYTINPYDVRIPCDVEPLCYNMTYIDAFLAQPKVQSALGVTGHKWSECNNLVHTLLLDDWIANLATDLPLVLSAGVNVLAYSGMDDYICNYVGGKDWILNFDWPGHTALTSATFKPTTAGGSVAIGNFITAKPISSGAFYFLEVYNAGHMVPMDQPQNALTMLNSFLFNANPF